MEGKKIYFRLQTKDEPEEEITFKRYAYLLKNQDYANTVIVQYAGDEKEAVGFPHGNAKKKSKTSVDFVGTCPSLLKAMKAEEGTPIQVYRKTLASCPRELDRHAINAPKDVKQVANVQFQRRLKSELSSNGLWNLMHIIDDTKFVKRLAIDKDNLMIFCFQDDLLDKFKCVLNRKDLRPQQLSYDTTFLLGDFYLSFLVFRETEFSTVPAIPCIYFIHERKLLETHEEFWSLVVRYVPELTSCKNTFIVTDQEAAIVSAIKKFLPDMDFFRCFNHVVDDIKRKIGTIVGLTAEEKKEYSDQCRELFSLRSKTDYYERLSEMQTEWNQQFITYYSKNIRPDIDRIGAWPCNKYGVSKITTNQSESLNCVIKGLNNWKEYPIDAMVLSLFQLSQYYNAEIMRGRYNYGQHRILPKLANLYNAEKDKPVLPEMVDPATIVQTIQDAEKDINTHFQKCDLNVAPFKNVVVTKYDEERLSVYERALSVINDKDGISIRPHTGEFVVKGTLGTSHVVTLFPKITCTCAGAGNCYHVLACDMAIGR